MPDSNPGPQCLKYSALPLSQHISKWPPTSPVLLLLLHDGYELTTAGSLCYHVHMYCSSYIHGMFFTCYSLWLWGWWLWFLHCDYEDGDCDSFTVIIRMVTMIHSLWLWGWWLWFIHCDYEDGDRDYEDGDCDSITVIMRMVTVIQSLWLAGILVWGGLV